MHFSLSDSVLNVYPDLTVGVLVLKDIDNSGSHPDIVSLLRRTEADARLSMPDIGAFKKHPNIIAWQEAHRAFGNNPKRYAPSVQAVCKRVVKGGELPTINPLVDLYNVISLLYVLPVGGEDRDACTGDITLAHAKGNEHFVEIGGEEDDPPEQGEVVYKDDAGVICRRFNWREAERTMLTGKTRNAVIVIEGLPPTTHDDVHEAVEKLQKLVQTYCGGDSEVVLLDREKQLHNIE